MMHTLSEVQLEAIDYYFRKTSEPYDNWEWDNQNLLIFFDGEVIENYSFDDLIKMIPNFEKL